MNSQENEEMWTPIHYASFSGKIEAIYTLIDNEANIFALNKSKLNVLHVAA